MNRLLLIVALILVGCDQSNRVEIQSLQSQLMYSQDTVKSEMEFINQLLRIDKRNPMIVAQVHILNDHIEDYNTLARRYNSLKPKDHPDLAPVDLWDVSRFEAVRDSKPITLTSPEGSRVTVDLPNVIDSPTGVSNDTGIEIFAPVPDPSPEED